MIFKNVNLYDLTCMQNFEVTIQVFYALLWIIFKMDLNLNSILKQGSYHRNIVDTWRDNCRCYSDTRGVTFPIYELHILAFR
jgi:hypothetical protein